MSRYTVKTMYLEKPEQLIIWNVGVPFGTFNVKVRPEINKSLHDYAYNVCHMVVQLSIVGCKAMEKVLVILEQTREKAV